MKNLNKIIPWLKKSNMRCVRNDSQAYYVDDTVKRDELIANIYRNMLAGAAWHEAIRTSKATEHGERVAEYAFASSLLIDYNPTAILDVGCVLNNHVISDVVGRHRRLFFLNPSVETVVYPEYTYFKFPLSKWDINLTFPFVTCLSTIEHIGFDNTRYGSNEIDKGWDWDQCIHEVVKSINILSAMTAPGGIMVASCPYGCPEYVLHPPVTGVRTAQTLHLKHVQALRDTFGDTMEIITLRLSSEGWVMDAVDAVYQPYGSIGPGASGLILMILKKPY